MPGHSLIRLFLLAGFFFKISSALPAQTDRVKVERLSKEDGLASQNVLSLLQDRQGFIWIGTYEGLQRYDGERFKTYRHIAGDSTSLPHNLVNKIFEDREGMLWIGTNNGICSFDPLRETFRTYPCSPSDPDKGFTGCTAFSFFEDEAGLLWISTYGGGLVMLDKKTGIIRHFSPAPNSAGTDCASFVSRICPLRNERNAFLINIQCNTGWLLYRFNTLDQTFTPYPGGDPLANQYLWSMTEDHTGAIWLAVAAGPQLLDPSNGRIQPFSLNGQTTPSPCIFVFEDRSGKRWFGTTQDGLYSCDPAGNWEHFTRRPGDPLDLGTQTLQCILEDRSGVIWVGTLEGGISRLVYGTRKFTPYRNQTDVLFQNLVNAIYEDRQGTVWVAMNYVGMARLDRAQGTLNYYPVEAPDPENRKPPSFYAVTEDHEGNLLLASNGSGMFVLSPDRTQLKQYLHNPADSTTIGGNHILAVMEDRRGRKWLSTYQGIDQFDLPTGRFTHFPIVSSFATEESNYFASTIFEDQSGAIWAGTDLGLARFDENSGRFRYLLDAAGPFGKFRNSGGVLAIAQDPRGVFWLGTRNGLCRLAFPDPAHPVTDHMTLAWYDPTNGLSDKSVAGILEDAQGRLWLSTHNGLFVFLNPNHDAGTLPRFRNYTVKNGLQSLEFKTGAFFKNKKGEFFFGGTYGLNVFHPDSIRNNTQPPFMAITGLETFDTDHPESGAVPLPGVSAREEVVLSYKNNIFTIAFAALDFQDPSQNHYAYQMEGFQDRWIELGTRREVTFTNLDPGTYIFRVKGSNNDGIWNETPATLRIVITPPWWKSTWAYAVYLALFVGGMYGFIRFRLRFLENRARDLEQAVHTATGRIRDQNRQLALQAESLRAMDEVKSRFFANVSHELRTPLTLLMGPINAVLKNWTADPGQRNLLLIAQENGRKLLRLISEILDLGKLDADRMAVEESEVAISPLLARLIAQFDSHADYLRVGLAYESEVSPKRIVLIDAKKFETVVNNLLSNALKFTPPGGSVTVTLREQGQNLLMTVRDTGRGIHADDLPHVFDRYFQSKRPDTPVEGGTGIGLALCAELTRLNGGRTWVESTPGEGSVFFVEWPLKTAATGRPLEMESPEPADEDRSTGLPAPADAAATSGGLVPKILIVEDNPDLQQYLHHVLAPSYDVETAGNGAEALEWLENGDAALILSDIMMPRMDGFQLLERLKKDDRYRHIPVVMLTARADMQDKLRALRIGVDDYLTKPFEEEELLARVENLLKHRLNRRPEAPGEGAEIPQFPRALISQADADWLAELEAWTYKNLKDEFLTVSAMAQQAALSERQLLRRLKELTGLGPQQYIAEIRLQKAREMLERGAFRTVAEVAYATGFGHAKVFSRVYRARYGRLPSSYL